MMKFKYCKISSSEEKTTNFAKEIASKIDTPVAIIIEGDLGAGKTVFTKGFAIGLGIEAELVSPTFTIMQQYEFGKGKILNHFDLYRLDNFDELFFIGIEDFLYDKNAINIFEWREKFFDDIKEYSKSFIHIKIDILKNYDREITINTDIENLIPEKGETIE